MISLKLTALIFLGLSCACLANEDVKSLIKDICDGPHEIYETFASCLRMLPEIAVKAKEECMYEISKTRDYKKFKKTFCESNRDIITEVKTCVSRQKVFKEYEMSPEDLGKILDTVACLKEVTID